MARKPAAPIVIMDTRDPALIALLRTLEPRHELVVRYALRGLFHARVGADRGFTARVDELRAQLDLDENGLAAVLREANALGERIAGNIAAAAQAPLAARQANRARAEQRR